MKEPLPEVPVESIIEKIDKPKSPKIAIKIMVGLLIIVILAEVGYLIYSNYLKSNTDSLSGPSINEIITTNPPISPETIVDNDPPNPPTISKNNINQKSLEFLSNKLAKPSILFKNASISYSFEAEISRVVSDAVDIDGVAYPHHIIFNIKDTLHTIYFSSRDLINASVIDQQAPNKKLDLLDLKVGEYVSLSSTTVLTNNPNNYSKYFIEILN